MNPTADLSQIQNRAYEIFLERNGQNGNSHEDWLQAEQEILEQPRGTIKIKSGSNIGAPKKIDSGENSGVPEEMFKAEQRVARIPKRKSI